MIALHGRLVAAYIPEPHLRHGETVNITTEANMVTRGGLNLNKKVCLTSKEANHVVIDQETV